MFMEKMRGHKGIKGYTYINLLFTTFNNIIMSPDINVGTYKHTA